MRAVRGRKPLFGLLSALMTLSFGGFVAVPAAHANNVGPGTIEVCKAAKNGMAGLPFQFKLNGGAPFTVTGGSCSGPMAAPAGNNTVVETQQAGLEVQKIKAKKVSENLATGTVVVKVKAGSTPANESLVTFTNRRNPAVGLKVCKVTTDVTLQGDSFSFTENGGPAYSVKAGTPASPICSDVHKYALDTQVNIAELAVPNTLVSNITVSDGRGSNIDTANRTVTATIGAGVTVVTYTNIVAPVPQFGYIEVCKSAGDAFVIGDTIGGAYVTGSFDFTITAPGFTATRSVLVGQCSEPIQVPAGNVSVTEAARFPYYVSNIWVDPSNRLVTKNLANGTVTVVVPKGDTNDETLVTYENSTRTGLIKVCKTLAANSGALAGTTFNFEVYDRNGKHGIDVTAGAAGSTTCVIDPHPLPLGSAVEIEEVSVDNVRVTAVSVSPASQNTGSAPPIANLLVGAGITTATFTNQAWGTVEICKTALDRSTETRTFQFSVNGGPAISVHAGQCSQPIPVPAGTATVYELGLTNFHLVTVTANGPAGENRIVSGFNPVTVSTPFGGVENETLVTFSNAVNTGQLKICKVSSETTLQDVYFDFVYVGDGVQGEVLLKPGQCSALSPPRPVVDANGDRPPIYVTENIPAGVDVSNIAVQNGTLSNPNYGTGVATVQLNQGITTITYTNVREPIANG